MKKRKQGRYTPEGLEKAVEAYFDMCKKTTAEAVSGRSVVQLSKPPTMEGLCTYLGLSFSTIRRYFNGEYPGEDEESRRRVADCMERARDYMTAETLEGALLGHYDSRICSMMLDGLGYGGKTAELKENKLTIEWKGVGAEEIKKWAE